MSAKSLSKLLQTCNSKELIQYYSPSVSEDESVEIICQNQKKKSLRSLDLNFCSMITRNKLEQILKTCSNLGYLSLINVPSLDNKLLIFLLSHLKHLQVLQAEKNPQIDHEFAEEFLSLSINLDCLTILNLNHSSIPPSKVEEMRNMYFGTRIVFYHQSEKNKFDEKEDD